MYFKRNPLAVSVGALLCAGFSTVALAQQAEQGATSESAKTLDTVQVTGSHIKRLQLSGVGPVSVVDAGVQPRYV